MRTAIIGAGLVGRAWAISFARAGHEVRLWDSDPAALPAALAFVDGVLPDLAAEGLLRGGAPAAVRARLSVHEDLAEALSGVGHAQESAPERVEVKRALFSELDRLAPPSATLASSTSALLPSAFQEHLQGRDRCLVCHPINPPYLVPAIEVVPSPWTSPQTVERAADFMRGCGQNPLVMKREIDGFIMNRLQAAVLEECFRLVADGYATPEDVDIGIRDGLALRWSFMGPFETIDLNAPGGVRDYAERYQSMCAGISAQMGRRVDWSGPVMDEVEADRAGRLPRSELAGRQVWRDRRLMALLAHKRRAGSEIGD